MNLKKVKLNQLALIVLVLVTSCVLVPQSFGLHYLVSAINRHVWLKQIPALSYNFMLLFIPMAFGVVYGDRKRDFGESLKIWLIGLITLILFYLLFYFINPTDFTAWSTFGALFPIIASTSALFTGLVFSTFFEPLIFDLFSRINNKQKLQILLSLTILIFITSAGFSKEICYSVFGIYLILPFAWGMFLRNIKISNKLLVISCIISIILIPIFVISANGFSSIVQFQTVGAIGLRTDWNPKILFDPTSPLLYFTAITGILLFQAILKKAKSRYLFPLISAIVIADAPIGATFWNKFGIFITSAHQLRRVLILAIFSMVAASFLIAYLIDKFIFPLTVFKNTENRLKGHDFSDLLQVINNFYSGLNKFLKKHKVSILTWIYFIALSFLTTILQSDYLYIQTSTAMTTNALTYLLGYQSFVFILSAIFIFALFAILYMITTRYWTANVITTVLVAGWAIANKIKLNLRDEPIYPSEFNEIVNWKSLLNMVGSKTVISCVIAIVILIAITIYLEIKHPIKFENLKHRFIWGILSILLFLTPLRFNHPGIIHNISIGFNNRPSFLNQKRDDQVNGPVLTLLNNIDLQIAVKPKGYSKADIDMIVKQYQKAAVQINKHRKNTLDKQTIMFNLSESFVDPKDFPTIEFKKGTNDPMAYIRSLMAQNTSGHMLSAGYGGGTANMEYESLTGFNMGNFETRLMPYTQVIPRFSYYPTIGSNFKYSSVIHPYVGTYYSRVEVYHKFKFNKFAYLGSKYNIVDQYKLGTSPYLSDKTAYDNALNQINSRKGGQFINLITMQNHMPYNNYYQNNQYINNVNGKLITDPTIKSSFENYTKGIEYTDEAMKSFISKIENINKPITMVFYGDHYPSVINQMALSTYPIKLHSTTYFIYSNKYAREHGSAAKINNSKFVSTTDFIAMMLEQTNSKVTPYQALLTEVHQDLPAITINYTGNKGLELIDQNGKQVKMSSLTKKQRKLLAAYQTIQYDMTAGKAYSLQAHDFYK